ncbi:MAG: alpha-N-arabinofuranosidase [Candidatus Latescibacterota bacterium]|nr:alpha-N-arabinofuranosidase [Candidatus Latescibacterota bacterium]
MDKKGKATGMLARELAIDTIDPRLYGTFLEHLGRAIYGGVFEPSHPMADKNGFRKDVCELVRELKTPIVRYPGGNFVSGYNWEDGVGPINNRPKRLDLAWKSLETNRFGMDEFVSWCREVKSEPMMAINLGTRGIDEARNIVEYCNHPSGTHYSEMRRSNGYSDPHAIHVWCLGNEMDGTWQIGHKSADEYGRLAQEAAKVMRLVDSEIELVLCGSSNRGMSTFPEWEATILDYAYDQVDYISLHTYFGNRDGNTGRFLAMSLGMDSFIEEVVATCDYVKAKRRTQKKMMLAFDEWNVWFHSNSADEKNKPWQVAPELLEDIYTMEDALVVGCMLISLIKHCDRVKIGCLAQLVNVIAPIFTKTGGGVVRQTTYYPFRDVSRWGRGIALDMKIVSPSYEDAEYGSVPFIEAVGVVDEKAGDLTVFAVNRDLKGVREWIVDSRDFSDYQPISHSFMRNDNLKACNVLGSPNDVITEEGSVPIFSGRELQLVLQPASWNVFRLRRLENE